MSKSSGKDHTSNKKIVSLRRWKEKRANETDIITEEQCAALRGLLAFKINHKRAMDARDAGLPDPPLILQNEHPIPARPPVLSVVKVADTTDRFARMFRQSAETSEQQP